MVGGLWPSDGIGGHVPPHPGCVCIDGVCIQDALNFFPTRTAMGDPVGTSQHRLIAVK